MNLPNKITVFRVILIPFFLCALLIPDLPYGKWIALGIFIVASLSDMLDGYLARKNNMVTDFGKFMDPLADKILVSSAMIALVQMFKIPAWIVIIIIAREFIISGFRLVAADNGVVIAAGMLGKIKTAVTMVTLCVLIADLEGAVINVLENVLIYASLILTILSLIDYFMNNKDVIKSFK